MFFEPKNYFNKIFLKLFNLRNRICIMNKAQGGAIGGGIVLAIIIGLIFVMFPSEGLVSSDEPQITEDTLIVPSEPGGGSIGINDSYTSEEGVEFYLDEEGNRAYVIEASDSPDLDE